MNQKHRLFAAAVVFIPAAFLLASAAGHLLRTRAELHYVTARIGRGDIVQSVAATGSLKPINTVAVGTQVSGPVVKLYADFNQRVKKGQLLAEIDPTLLQSQIEQSQAQLDNSRSAMQLAGRNAARLKRLFEAGYISRADWEQADQAAKTARTSYQVSQAQLDRDRKTLEFARVRSPVDGIVISRQVSEGQTVQASFQTPELYTIAEDLTEMQIEIRISEADVGSVKERQHVYFSVDAYPGRTFDGTLTQLRLNPETQNGVVTYTAVVRVDNADTSLLPGMTAYVNVVVAENRGVRRIPNAALRFAQSMAAAGASVPAPGGVAGAYCYVLRDGHPQQARISTGAADEQYTEVTGGEVGDQDQVILRAVREVPSPGAAGNGL